MSTHAVAGRPSVQSLAAHGGTPVSEKPISMIAVVMDEADIQAALGVLRSGMLAMGKNCLAFEQEFARLSEAKHALSCANGTVALQLAYEPLFNAGDEVLVPAWSYIATVSMVVARGGVPVFVDADPHTYNVDVADLEAKITPRTASIAVTHLYGNPVDIGAIQKIAARRGLTVIYDAAQAHLATYNGRGIGAFGDAVTYSFYPTKNMTTGEGGMVTVNDDALNTRIKLLRSHGETAKYVHSHIGFNYRMTDLEGAIGLSQCARLQGYTDRRRANAAYLDGVLANIPGLHAPTVTENAQSAYHLYAVRIDSGAFVAPEGSTPTTSPEGLSAEAARDSLVRDAFCKALNAEGVGTAIHYPRPLSRQPVFQSIVRAAGGVHPPVADRLAGRLFCIPVHHALSEQQMSRIGEALQKVAAAYRA